MDDFGGKPVPIRLAQRYPNGSMMSYSARAVSRHGDSLRVLVNEDFEAGELLSVMAPFLEGLTACRVVKALRSRKQSGYFEVILRIGDGREGNAVRGSSSDQAESASPPKSGEENGESPLKRAAPVSSAGSVANGASERATPRRANAAEIASLLANALAARPRAALSELLLEFPEQFRPVALRVSVAALLHVLQRENLLRVRGVLGPPGGART